MAKKSKQLLGVFLSILCVGTGVLAVYWHSTGLGWLCFGLLLATYDAVNA